MIWRQSTLPSRPSSFSGMTRSWCDRCPEIWQCSWSGLTTSNVPGRMITESLDKLGFLNLDQLVKSLQACITTSERARRCRQIFSHSADQVEVVLNAGSDVGELVCLRSVGELSDVRGQYDWEQWSSFNNSFSAERAPTCCPSYGSSLPCAHHRECPSSVRR